MMNRWLVRSIIMVGLLGGGGCAMRSTVGHFDGAPVLPVAGEAAALCTTYAERLEVTRAQMKRRNALGRLDLLRGEHRAMERFVATHCS